jgi:hypothetical protein
MSSLPRLFNLEGESVPRLSSLVEGPSSNTDYSPYMSIDPWRSVMAAATGSKEGLSYALEWLCLFARSGVDIPVSSYLDFSSLAVRFNASLTDGRLLVEAAMSSAWLKSMGRQQLQELVSALHTLLAPQVLHRLQTKAEVTDA